MKRTIGLILLTAFVMSITGCGETFMGVAKDVRRMGKGVRTFFFRDSGN